MTFAPFSSPTAAGRTARIHLRPLQRECLARTAAGERQHANDGHSIRVHAGTLRLGQARPNPTCSAGDRYRPTCLPCSASPQRRDYRHVSHGAPQTKIAESRIMQSRTTPGPPRTMLRPRLPVLRSAAVLPAATSRWNRSTSATDTSRTPRVPRSGLICRSIRLRSFGAYSASSWRNLRQGTGRTAPQSSQLVSPPYGPLQDPHLGQPVPRALAPPCGPPQPSTAPRAGRLSPTAGDCLPGISGRSSARRSGGIERRSPLARHPRETHRRRKPAGAHQPPVL